MHTNLALAHAHAATAGRSTSRWTLALLLTGFCGVLHAQTPAAPEDPLARAHAAYASGQHEAARADYARLAGDTNAPAPLRSLAQLSLAQAWRREKNPAQAEHAYARVLTLPGVPAHHRAEAQAQLAELQRLRAGQPARDPAASRTPPPSHPKPALTWHVAPSGSDAQPGTETQPFATLERARDEIRRRNERGPLPAGGAAIVIHGGTYPVRRTFALARADSGTAEAPVVYRAAQGETPVFSGGARISRFEPVRDPAILARLPDAARGQVMQADLKADGVSQVPPVRVGGFASGAGFRSHPGLELFFDGQAMPLARWPNEGFVNVAEVRGATPQAGHGPSGAKEGVFTYTGDRPARWTEDPDILLYGYWFYGWADSYERVQKIDLEKKEIALAPPYHTYGYRRGQPFHALNLLSEIDQPGEWYLDRRTLTLYFYPPMDLRGAAGHDIAVSVTATPFVELNDVAHVAFEGLTWELGCTDAILARGGSDCLLAGCTVRQFAGNGIEFAGGSRHRVLSCDLYSMGRGGVVMTGGDRRTLTPGGQVVENCHIRELSRLDRTYTPAVLLNGAGNRVAHNLFHDIRSSALRIEGNDHTVEFNEIGRVVLESDDQGGVDMFGNPTYRGNVYRFNYFHHIGSWQNAATAPDCGQAGIRLDDMISGTLIYGNIFRRCAAGRLGFGGVQIHGGKENILDNNLFIECATAVSFSPWGEPTWRERSKGALDGVDRARYLERYPDLARLDQDLNVNHLWRNLAVNCGEFLRRNRGGARLLGNGVVTNTTAFPDAARGVFSFQNADTLLAGAGFQSLPFEEIGLYRDAFRPKLPLTSIAELRSGIRQAP